MRSIHETTSSGVWHWADGHLLLLAIAQQLWMGPLQPGQPAAGAPACNEPVIDSPAGVDGGELGSEEEGLRGEKMTRAES